MIEKISTPDTNVLIRAILKDAIGYMETIALKICPVMNSRNAASASSPKISAQSPNATRHGK